MAEIICFANSKKPGGRCIAGIECETEQWIRPVSLHSERAIGTERLLNGQEPNLLDILDVPVATSGPDEGCQPENRLLRPGRWSKVGETDIATALQLCEQTDLLLHNDSDKVAPDYFENLSSAQWKSLQLIRVQDAHYFRDPWRRYRCEFSYAGIRYELSVTDLIIRHKMSENQTVSRNCILTISMATPHKSPAYKQEYCWKMVAGVIELD